MAARPRPLARALTLDLDGDAPALLLGATLVTAVASVDGGWAPTSWGWTSLALAAAAAVIVVLRSSFEVTRLELGALAALAAFAAWTLLSARWSGDAGASVLSFERVLVYVTALAAAIVVVRARSYPALLGGVWLAATLVCCYATATRLYPDRFPPPVELAGNRLAAPVGYWNSLGLLATLGLLLALGLAATARARVARAAAAASVVPLVLALYFTFSRGAWLVLGLGLLVALALDPRRARFAVAAFAAAPWAALAVWRASTSQALTAVSTTPDVGTAGTQLAHVALLLAAGAAVAALAIGEAERRVTPPPAARWLLAALLVAGALAGLVALTARVGNPVTAAWSSFTGGGGAGNARQADDLNARLFSLSANGRLELWRVALDTWRDHPVLGAGAGTYERHWLADRPIAAPAVNAHNLYAETLAETGPLGLALLLSALLAPLPAAIRARRRALVPAAAAVYAAFLVHLFFDWDWQLPGVALAGVLAGVGLLVAARPDRRSRPRPRVAYLAAGALCAVALVCALTLVGNRAAAAAGSANAHDDFARAVVEAGRARSWQSWSSRPWQLLGEAQLQQGRLADARASFRRGLEKAPESWRLWLDLAFASETPKEQRAAARRASVLNPLSTEINRLRAAIGLTADR